MIALRHMIEGVLLGEYQKQPLGKTLGQLWGVVFLLALFGAGGFRLTDKAVGFTHGQGLTMPDSAMRPQTGVDYLLYGLMLGFGLAKGEMLFRRKFIARTLARGRDALGETPSLHPLPQGGEGRVRRSVDYLLAPFCMLSLYRPWRIKHLILSWVLIPVMVGLAVIFVVVVPDSPFKGAVDLGIGVALFYGAMVYLMYLVRFLQWWLQGANAETHPFPRKEEV